MMKRAFAAIFLLFVTLLSFGQNYNVGEQTINYMDSSRNRPVNIEVWYPANEQDPLIERKTELPFILPPTIRNAKSLTQPFPLIVISHGTGGNRFSLAWMAIELAKKGYVVVAPDHWGNTFDNKTPEYFVRYWERPLDISFLLTSLLKDESLIPSINEEKIGMIGFSFGGYTALAVGGVNVNCELLKRKTKTKQGKREFTIPEMGDLTDLIDELSCHEIPENFKDNRFKVFVSMAPALGLGLVDDEIQNITSPVLIIGAENDKVAPLSTNALKYKKLIPDSEFMMLEGKVGHYIFLNRGNEELQKVARRYYRDHKSANRELIHKKVNAEVLMFLNQYLK